MFGGTYFILSIIIKEIPHSREDILRQLTPSTSATGDSCDISVLVAQHEQFTAKGVMVAVLLVAGQVEDVVIWVVIQVDETVD